MAGGVRRHAPFFLTRDLRRACDARETRACTNPAFTRRANLCRASGAGWRRGRPRRSLGKL